ncbi:hypothetical protein AX774_g540 [Zancudomyces culisetae]|uniref:Uncharacterized protein n=1 Tax=Zancudomyces culisetae TaxID=1213189 RepID=A0A1R1PY51_ZANCU|nr:hypothetical protein AX774_g540 [Zancudomyces culisetae]|eukprot:OMH85895.1 hypothetical protein AX774_g540 [Zancudomyces culisetae]
MSYLKYLLQPENLIVDFGAQDFHGVGRSHPKYNEACELLRRFAHPNNLGLFVVNINASNTKRTNSNVSPSQKNPERVLAEEANEKTIVETPNNANDKYNFGPSTPQSPGMFDSLYEDDGENLEDQKRESMDIDTEKSVEPSGRTPFEKNMPISQYSMIQRNKKTGLPLKKLKDGLEPSIWGHGMRPKSERNLVAAIELIKLIQFEVPDIEALVHSAVRHVLFMYLVEKADDYIGEKTLWEKRVSETSGMMPVKEYCEFAYHWWVSRSIYREKAMSFEISYQVEQDGEYIDEVHTKYLEQVVEELGTGGQSGRVCGLVSYDIARGYFARDLIEKSLQSFTQGCVYYPELRNMTGRELTRLVGEKATVGEYIQGCTNILSVKADNVQQEPETNGKVSPEKTDNSLNFQTNIKEDIWIEQLGLEGKYDSAIREMLRELDQQQTVAEIVGQKNTKDMFYGLTFGNKGGQITEALWRSANFVQGMRLLEEDNYGQAVTWLEQAASEMDEAGHHKIFASQGSTSANSSGIPGMGSHSSGKGGKATEYTLRKIIKEQALAYMHLAKVLDMAKDVELNDDEGDEKVITDEYGGYKTRGEVLEEIKKHAMSALSLGSSGNALEMGMGMGMGLGHGGGDFKPFSINEENDNFGPAVTKNGGEGKNSKFDLQIYTKEMVENISNAFKSVFENLVKLANEGKRFNREFDRFCFWMNDTKINMMLNGFLMGYLWSLIESLPSPPSSSISSSFPASTTAVPTAIGLDSEISNVNSSGGGTGSGTGSGSGIPGSSSNAPGLSIGNTASIKPQTLISTDQQLGKPSTELILGLKNTLYLPLSLLPTNTNSNPNPNSAETQSVQYSYSTTFQYLKSAVVDGQFNSSFCSVSTNNDQQLKIKDHQIFSFFWNPTICQQIQFLLNASSSTTNSEQLASNTNIPTQLVPEHVASTNPSINSSNTSINGNIGGIGGIPRLFENISNLKSSEMVYARINCTVELFNWLMKNI